LLLASPSRCSFRRLVSSHLFLKLLYLLNSSLSAKE
jgi:hypothetical protein